MNRTLSLIRALFESEDRWLDSYHRLGGALAKWDESIEPFRAQGAQASEEVKANGIGSRVRAFLHEAMKNHPEARWLTNYDVSKSTRANGHIIGFDPRLPEGIDAQHHIDGRIILGQNAHDRLRGAAKDYARDQGFPFHLDGATHDIGPTLEILYHEATHGLDHHRAHGYRGLARALMEVNNVYTSRSIASYTHGPIMHPSRVPYGSTVVHLTKGLFPLLGGTYSGEDVRVAMNRAAWFWKDAQPRTSEEAGDVYANAMADALPNRGRHGSMDRDDRAELLRKHFRSLEASMVGWDGVKNIGAPKETK